MSVVIDASMATTWLLPDERTAATDGVLDELSMIDRFVPSIFWHEIRNILIIAERRKRINANQAVLLLSQLDLLKLQDRGHGRSGDVLALARSHALTAYDAAYLALAWAENAGLATLDKKLAAAARLEGVPLLGPLAL